MMMVIPIWSMLAVIPSSAQVKGQASGPAILHAGSGSVELTVENTGKTAVPLTLNVGPFNDEVLHAILAKPKVDFVLLPASDHLPVKIKAQEKLRILMTISNLSGSSIADAGLFNGNSEIGSIKSISFDAPLNITIEGDGSAGKPLPYVYGQSPMIALKNNDAQSYSVTWTFQLNGRPKQTGTLNLIGNGISQIPLNPAREDFSYTEIVHPSEGSAVLSLRLAGPAPVANDLYPSKTLPVSLSLMLVGKTWSKRWSYVYTFVLLFLGGIVSVLGSSLLPNILKKISLRGQLNDLAARTTSVSTRVDSYLRVLLRLERKKIDVLLQGTWVLSLTSADAFDQAAIAIQRLTTRLAFAERLDGLRRTFEQISPTAPPSLTDGLDKKLQSAADQLHAFVLTDANQTAACNFLDEAERSLAQLDDPDSLAKSIATSFTALKARITQFPIGYYADLAAALPGVFAILTEPFDDPKNITQRMQFAIDHAIAAIHTTLDYAVVRSSLPTSSTVNCANPGATGNARLSPHECDLLVLLGTFSWRALRDASILVQQMREDIYELDVLDEISKPNQAEIMFDTQRARPYLPVFFTVGFKDSRYNGAAAINQLACRWTFPGNLNEDGWKVCHFFPNNEPNPHLPQSVTVSAEIQSQKVPAIGAVGTLTLTKQIEIQGVQRSNEYSRAMAEILRFFIAFGVALAGLWSGALTQLEKLDFAAASIAILALGYGADSIKNLLVQAPKKN